MAKRVSKCDWISNQWICNYTAKAIVENSGLDYVEMAKVVRPKSSTPPEVKDLLLTFIKVSFGEDKSIRIVKTATVTPVDIVSNVGGTLGLFSGFSILSGMEIVYWILIWISSKIYPKSPKSKHVVKRQKFGMNK